MMDDKNYCTIYIVRHGETEYNVSGRIQGQSDTALTKKGLLQAKKIAKTFKDIHFDAVFSSDLLRAKKTAEIIAAERDVIIQTSKLLRERTFGKYEGRPGAEFFADNQELIKKMEILGEMEKRSMKFDEGYESEEEMIARLLLFLRELAIAYIDKTVLVVCHSGNIRALLFHLGFWPEVKPLSSKPIQNTAYIKLLTDGVDFFIKQTRGIAKRA